MGRAVASQVVDDPADPRLADYVGLTDSARRMLVEPASGFFIAEGELVVRRALRAGYHPRSFLLASQRVGLLADLDLPPATPTFLASPAVLAAVTGFQVHRGVLAAIGRRPLPAAEELLAAARRVLVCEGLNNPTNLGAVFRSAAGLGMDAVLLDPLCCDPLYRRAVRVSMGEVFAVPWTRLAPWPAALASVRSAGFPLLALTPDQPSTSLADLVLAPGERAAVLLGAEGPGLTAGALAAADRRVRIPMAAGVDSLNVAAAASIACYLLGRR